MEERTLLLVFSYPCIHKPKISNQCKEKGCREEGGSDNDAPPDGVAIFDKVDPVDKIGDHVKDK